jgi:hypothetical protein
MICEKCGMAMLESDYDYYCPQDEVLVKKDSAPQVLSFLENESVIMMLEESSRRIGLLDKTMSVSRIFRDAVLTNQRLVFLNDNNLLDNRNMITIPLKSIQDVSAERVPGLLTTLRIDEMDGRSTSVVFLESEVISEQDERQLAEEWADAINRLIHHLESYVQLSDLLNRLASSLRRTKFRD